MLSHFILLYDYIIILIYYLFVWEAPGQPKYGSLNSEVMLACLYESPGPSAYFSEDHPRECQPRWIRLYPFWLKSIWDWASGSRCLASAVQSPTARQTTPMALQNQNNNELDCTMGVDASGNATTTNMLQVFEHRSLMVVANPSQQEFTSYEVVANPTLVAWGCPFEQYFMNIMIFIQNSFNRLFSFVQQTWGCV